MQKHAYVTKSDQINKIVLTYITHSHGSARVF